MTQPRGPATVVVRVEPGVVLSDRTRPAESWYAAARRLLRAGGHPDLVPVAVDLSGPDKSFTCHIAGTLGYRAMTHADLPVVLDWQREPHVARWFRLEDPANAAASYAAAIEGRDPTRMGILEVAGRPVGFVQDYRVADHPEWALLTGEPDAIGFDYAIGDPASVGRGLGTAALWFYLVHVVRTRYPEAPTFFAAPDHRNTASLRVLDKLGFRRGLWFDEPQFDGSVDTVVGCTLDVRMVMV